jgi:hypothetical protein
MLGSITSLGERSRGRRWAVTYAWFVAGSLTGGLALAIALFAVREVGRLLPDAAAIAIGFAGAGALFAVAALGRMPPSLDRQVDHRWLDRYRGWVIGAGFGFQLGAAVFTRISSFALYLLALCALLGASRESLLVAALGYAAVRAASAAPGGLIASPRDLQRLVERFGRSEPLVDRFGRATDVVAAAAVLAALVTAVA